MSKKKFELTAEEVEFIGTLLIELMEYRYFDRNTDDLLAHYLFTRIKQWQDENRTDKGTKPTSD